MNSNTNDTIVALATPYGMGAIAVIRLSGYNVFPIIEAIFKPKNKKKKIFEMKSHTSHLGYLKDEDKIVDEVLLNLFKAPHSYTGEDIIEISCHGSTYIQNAIVEVLIKNGARAAEPGEFTQRAFMNGKMDLSQTEAVADLIHSQSEAAKNIAINQLRGGISSDIKLFKEELIQFASLIELELDFSEEDVEFADRTRLMALIKKSIHHINDLIQSFKYGNAIKNGISTAIIGKPNAGKSTLLNSLLNEERAIVTEIPGTTRDTIEEVLYVRGIQFRFIDTAGIRETEDVIEKIGVEKAIEKMRSSQVFVYLFDINTTKIEELKAEILTFPQDVPFLLVANKIDICLPSVIEQFKEVIPDLIFISTKDKLSIEIVKLKLIEKLELEHIDTNAVIITNTRHLEAFQNTLDALMNIKSGIENNIPGDLLSIDLRQALYYLGSVTGEITSDDVLGNIFSKFCIGK